MTTLSKGDWLTIDGATGQVFAGVLEVETISQDQDPYHRLMRTWQNWYLPTEEVTEPQSFELSLPTHTTVKDSNRQQFMKESKWWPELELGMDLNRVVADFYLLNHAIIDNPNLSGAFNAYAEIIARQIAVYLDGAIGGEARHKKGGFKNLSKGGGRALARRDWRKMRVEQGVTLVTELKNDFFMPHWHGAIGGKRWGQIADVLNRFLLTEIPPSVFIDLAFDLQHNCGVVFNKLAPKSVNGQSVGWAQGNLKKLLDAKFHDDYDSLRTYASPSMLILIDNFTEDDVVIVHGSAEAKASLKQQSALEAGDLQVGGKAEVKSSSKKKELHGKVGYILKIKEYGKLTYATIHVPGHEPISLSVKNLKGLTAETIVLQHREYYTEALSV